MKQEEIFYKKKDGSLVSTNIIKETYNNDDEWKENRPNGIGASEVPSIIGIDPYISLYKWWRVRKGLDEPQETNEAMERGHFLEDGVAKYFEYKSGLKVYDNSANNDVYFHKDFPWRRVTPDRIGDLSRRTRDFSTKFLLECKTYRGHIENGDYPKKWRAQVMYQLGVTGCKVGFIAWLDSSLVLDYDRIDFNQKEFDDICDAVDAAWKYCIEGDVEPDAVTAEDYKCKFPKQEDGKYIELDNDYLYKVEKIQELDASIKKLSEEKDALVDEVKIKMEDAEFATDPAGVVLCTYKASKSFNEEEFKERNPELYKKYTTSEPVFNKTAYKKAEGAKAYEEYCTSVGSRSIRFPKKK